MGVHSNPLHPYASLSQLYHVRRLAIVGNSQDISHTIVFRKGDNQRFLDAGKQPENVGPLILPGKVDKLCSYAALKSELLPPWLPQTS